ncbi:MAG: DUF4870 domain-containing protein [Candidatus Cybelea sp.]|jgi:hypothetical protein
MQVQIPAQERNWAMAAHLSALVAVAGMPFGHILGPLIVYLIKGHESEFVGEHARASLNYQISISIYVLIAVLVALAATFGFIAPMQWAAQSTVGYSLGALWIAFGAFGLVILLASFAFIILGTVAAGEGRPYTYPLAIRFLR